MNLTKWQDAKDHLFGKLGTAERESYEAEVQAMLVPLQLLKDQRQIEGSLANDENSSDEEMLANLIEWCPGFDPALIERIIKEQRPIFYMEPLHTIDWVEYELPNEIFNIRF